MKTTQLRSAILEGQFDARFAYIYGEEAVALGLMDAVGNLSDALEALYTMIERKREKEDA